MGGPPVNMNIKQSKMPKKIITPIVINSPDAQKPKQIQAKKENQKPIIFMP